MEDETDGRVRVEIQGLWVRFGAVAAVRGIDLTALAGRATALLGRNGAGKSTTMRVLAGVIPPTEGIVRVDGIDVADDPLAVKRLTGYCPDVGGLVPRATPWEHLQLAARLRRLDDWEDRGTGPARAVRARRRRPPGDLRLQPRHGPAALGDPGLLPRPVGAPARRALRRCGPDRCRGDPRGDRRRPGPRGRRTRLARTCATSPWHACENALVLRGGASVAELRAHELVGEEGAGVYRALLD